MPNDADRITFLDRDGSYIERASFEYKAVH
jgi:hypothetical protein